MVSKHATMRKTGGKNAITNVRVVDHDAGPDGLYVDRCISTLQNSESLITLLVSSTVSTGGGTSASSFTLGHNSVIGSDEFVSMAAQFELFRIRAARFDVYDLAPAVLGPVAFSTFHDQLTTVPTWTFDQVIDGPDSKLIPLGEGKATFYWRAHGTLELGWQSTNGTASPALQYLGGLRVAYPASSTGKAYQINTKFIVDFRGRY